MSQRDVERVLGRLLTDEQFRRDFYDAPSGACVTVGIQLAGYELEAVLAAPRLVMENLGNQLDARIRRLKSRATADEKGIGG